MNAGETLYCVGCGQAVATYLPGATLAIACRCGANAPILFDGESEWPSEMSGAGGTGFAPPASLIKAITMGRSGAHTEYYLGYSEHESPTRSAVVELLTKLGMTSQKDCPDERCDGVYEQQRTRHRDWDERGKRIKEIGEP